VIPVADDGWFDEAVDDIARASETACDRLARYNVVLRRAVQELETTPLRELVRSLLVEEARGLRSDVYGSIAEWQRCVQRLRSLVVRRLVDDDGLTFAEVARHLSISRQMATRLYNSTDEEPGEDAD
jgi:hypothetical protein